MTYVPEGFKIGLILSVTSLAIFIIIAVKTKKQGEKQQKDKK